MCPLEAEGAGRGLGLTLVGLMKVLLCSVSLWPGQVT